MKNIKELLQDPNVTILDVRSPMEYQSGHINGAINIPVDEMAYRMDELKALTPPFILYCRSGARSSMAAHYMTQAGFTEVYNAGGLADMHILTM
jgi:rhodanese-related sulfurtransferase